MRIIQISPGSGNNFYCGNCLRDAALARTLRALGHDVLLVPLYLPGQYDGLAVGSPLFFGGINVYLQQKFSFFRKSPRWLDSIFDNRKLLGWASKKAGTTSPQELGQTLISMLQGENGRQVKELNRLLDWLEIEANRPDVVVLSNLLLAGLAGAISQQLGCKVVCLLQDEDEFIDSLDGPDVEAVWQMIGGCCENIDGFISVSSYYAASMRARLGIEPERMHVVYSGVNPEGGGIGGCSEPALGFLSRMCAGKGLDVLAEAFIRLKKNGFDDLKLKVAGGMTEADRDFVGGVRDMLARAGVGDDVQWLCDFDVAGREAFFRSISVLSVPEKRPGSDASYMLESLGWSVPVVMPGHGVFPEILARSGGGVLFEPGDVDSLVSKLAEVLGDCVYARELGAAGRLGVVEHFDIGNTAAQLAGIYAGLCGADKGVCDA